MSVATRDNEVDVTASQAVFTYKDELVCYSAPNKDGAENLAVYLRAFSPDTVHRDR